MLVKIFCLMNIEDFCNVIVVVDLVDVLYVVIMEYDVDDIDGC